jgi:hypothetical protein
MAAAVSEAESFKTRFYISGNTRYVVLDRASLPEKFSKLIPDTFAALRAEFNKEGGGNAYFMTSMDFQEFKNPWPWGDSEIKVDDFSYELFRNACKVANAHQDVIRIQRDFAATARSSFMDPVPIKPKKDLQLQSPKDQ